MKGQPSDHVAMLTLNRPQARNALDADMLKELSEALEALEQDDEVKVVVITGADPAFCAGLDLKELARPGGLAIGELTRQGAPWPTRHKPWVGAVNGVAITGGLELALACDVVLCSERARFADTHARVGILPFWGLTSALPAAIGLQRARFMTLTGSFIGAEQAVQWGLASQVVPHAALLDTARAVAVDIASNDLHAAARIIDTYAQQRGLTPEAARALEQERALTWQGDGVSPQMLAKRIEAVQTRGRQQSRG